MGNEACEGECGILRVATPLWWEGVTTSVASEYCRLAPVFPNCEKLVAVLCWFRSAVRNDLPVI